MGEEDKRVAVGISVTLSSQLIAAALAILAAQGGYVAYALANRITSPGFGLVAILGGLCFVASIFVAGKAVTEARDAGFEGTWKREAGKSKFNLQAYFCLIGLVLLAVMLGLSGDSQANNVNGAAPATPNLRAEESEEIELLRVELAALKNQVDALKGQCVSGERQFQAYPPDTGSPSGADSDSDEAEQ